MLVQEKILREGSHVADRINELGLKVNEWKLEGWNPQWASIFYDTTENMRFDKESGKWMKKEEEEGFGVTNKKLAGQK